MSKPDLPEIAHLRGLGEPMFFTFNIQPKSNILICHAAIMGTFVLHPKRTLELCKLGDDPRLPHFIDYLGRNEFLQDSVIRATGAIDELDKLIAQRKNELTKLGEQIKRLTP